MTRSCEEDPAFDYLLMLFLEATGEPLTVLPTHRLLRGHRGRAGGRAPGAGRRAVRRRARRNCRDAGAPRSRRRRSTAGGEGRFGLWTRGGGAFLTARRDAFAPYLPAGGKRCAALDVTLLGRGARAAGRHRCRCRRGRRRRATRSRRPRPSQRSGPATGSMPRSSWSATPVASIEAVARRRRRHAPEIDLLLPEGPDRPRHQPARVVSRV